ncbi:MAG: group 1 truncated hemoglobin [Deltaproteobacteria bacterium]|nr:group 1 truncated hemoglobin [Deltaproteobacteria bacterium]
MKAIKLSGPALGALFSSIGGEASLDQILARFYQKMSTDVLLGFFFDGCDVLAIARMQKSFLMRAWGVSQSYAGKSPADAHAKLPPILKGHFDRRLVLLAETLREFKVGENEIALWVSFEEKFRAAVEHS